MIKKKLVIVGAGIAGLSAGIYAQKCGFETTLIESHSLPGGNCTSWRRNGYLFEGAIHWLSGSSARDANNIMWRETGALNNSVKVYYNDPCLYTNYKGIDIFLYRDLNRLQEHFFALSPDDAKAVKKLCKDIRHCMTLQIPLENEKGLQLKYPAPKMTLRDIRDIIAMIPAFMDMGKQMKISVEDYVKMFKHEGIRRLLAAAVPSYVPSMALVFYLAIMCGGNGGYPEGGSLAMVQRMADTFKSLGGELLLNIKAEKVIIENNMATGIRCAAKTINADCIILAMDTISAVNTLFNIPLTDPWITEIKQTKEGAVCTFVGIGVKADMSHLPHSIILNLEKPLDVAGETMSYIYVNNYAAHKEYAPEGCTALTVILGLTDTYEWWKKAKAEGRYDAEKESLKKRLMKILAAHFPQTRGKIDIINIATPLTYERYTGTWHGAYMGMMKTGAMPKACPATIANIRNVFFAGQRTKFPGGLPPALESGRRAVQLLCKEYGVVFQNEAR
jgi:phytoene dehydrogenase-like protein